MDHCRQKMDTSQELKHISQLHSADTNMYLSKFKTGLIILDNVRTGQPRGTLRDIELAVYYKRSIVVVGVDVQHLFGRR